MRLLLCLMMVLLGVLAGGGCALSAADDAPGEPAGQERRPNILLVVADDMGFSDVGAYGGEIDTPALDALAEHGLRFTNFYTNNMCVPTRAALMTGTYPQVALRGPGNSLGDRVVTIAEMLGDAGYATWMSGKWHLAPWDEQAGQQDVSGWPRARGFDRFFGTIIGAGSFFAPASLTRGDEPADHEYLRDGFYYTDAITDNAIRLMEESLTGDNPFFGYVTYTAPHWPLHALPEDIAKYDGRFDEGWDVLRARRYERMVDEGLVDPSWPLSPRDPEVPAWEDVPEARRAWEVRRMEVYAAQIDRMDQGIGRIVDALRRAGELDDTLILFLTDNGACHVALPPSRRGDFLPDTTRDGWPVRNGNLANIMPGPEDTYQSYGRGWANLGSTPFRLFKQHDHEGGIRTPLIVHWPARLEHGGRITRQMGHIMDVMPTALEVAGLTYPETYDGQSLEPLQGTSLVPVFDDERRAAPDTLYWRWARGRAIRQGDWKLVSFDDGPWELYDVRADGTELNDLAAAEPEKARALATAWESWAERVDARPMPD